MYETWFHKSDRSLAVLTSNDRCFVMFMKHADETSLVARVLWDNRRWHPLMGTAIPFLLENGQVDEHDIADTISAADAMRVVAYFVAHGEPAPCVHWGDLDVASESGIVDGNSNREENGCC